MLCLFQIEGIDPVYIPVKMDVVGCPLNFQMMKDQAPILRWVVGGNVHLPTFCLNLDLNNKIMLWMYFCLQIWHARFWSSVSSEIA